jgi:hypothetical protein
MYIGGKLCKNRCKIKGQNENNTSPVHISTNTLGMLGFNMVQVEGYRSLIVMLLVLQISFLLSLLWISNADEALTHTSGEKSFSILNS